jgi:asparagine synthase (glutamine-hydrolysing)
MEPSTLPISPSRPFLSAFHDALAEVPEGAAVLYSGGLDSSLVAFCLDHLQRAPRLVGVGAPGAPDLVSAKEGAALLGASCELHALSVRSIEEWMEREGARVTDLPEPARSVRIAFGLALETLPAGPVVCGQGADELFGGYGHFRGVGAEEAERRRSEDLRRLLEVDWPWAQQQAARGGLSLHSPFVARPVVNFSLALPVSEWFDAQRPKAWLRELAASHGLPRELAERPKRAMQYGSRVAREVQRLAPRVRKGGSEPPDPHP